MKKPRETRQRVAVNRIATLVLVNAMIFQEILAQRDFRVRPLQQFRKRENLISELRDHWQFILIDINYYPIFDIAHKLLSALAADVDMGRAVENLINTALQIVSWRAALRHDLAGRIYHRLLEEAKYLGAYYTSIPAAALLLKLSLRPDRYRCDWSDLNSSGGLRIADLACGTGTLLMAAADAVTDNYVRACSQNQIPLNLNELHHALLEHIIFGFDVIPSAIHLTASTLMLRVPDDPVNLTNLYSLPLGGPNRAMGSLDFLWKRTIEGTFFASPGQITGNAETKRPVTLSGLDLCVMNPPFTRSVGGNLLFGSLPSDERKAMQKKLQRLIKSRGVPANITAGLGAVFVAVADRYLKRGGRLALVLPKAVLSGVAWSNTRGILRKNYRVEYLVASHDPERWNFSESTNLSEILLVCKKNGEDQNQQVDEDGVVAINLWRNPSTTIEAFNIAQTLIRNDPPDLFSGQGALEVYIGEKKVGEAVSSPWRDLRGKDIWMLPCAFAQSDLTRVGYYLLKGEIWIPGKGIEGNVPLSGLGRFGNLGPDRRDIHDGFRVSKNKTNYPAFWGHDAKRIFSLHQEPNLYLSPLSKPKENRHLRKVEDLWPYAGMVLIAERLRLNTQKVVCIRLTEPVLSNVWWPFSIRDGLQTEHYEKTLTMWFNSTLGLILLLVHRVETEGPWVDFKKPILAKLPILDLEALSPEQFEHLSNTYDELSDRAMMPFPEMASDKVRAAIDEAIANILGIKDLSPLRELLAREPVVCLKPI